MPAAKLPDHREWDSFGRACFGYCGHPAQYIFPSSFTASDIVKYDSKANCMNNALELCFGLRADPKWSIWARGDHMNSLMLDIRSCYLQLMDEKEDMRLVDLDNDWLCVAFALDPDRRQLGLEDLLRQYDMSARLPAILEFIHARLDKNAKAPDPPFLSRSQSSTSMSSSLPTDDIAPQRSFARFKGKPAAAPVPADLWAAFNEDVSSMASTSTDTMPEAIDRYWGRFGKAHPGFDALVLLARDVLAIPVSSAGVERLFSLCGIVYGHNRGRLGAKNLMAQASVGEWAKEGYDLENDKEDGDAVAEK